MRTLSGWRRCGAALCAGAISALAFAPFNIFVAQLLGYAALLLLLEGVATRRPALTMALIGWAFGFGQFFVGLFWISHAFQVDAAKHAWQIPFVLTLLPGGLALFPALACAAAALFRRSSIGRALGLAAALGLAQYLRGHILTGFPWNIAAYGWGAMPEILQSTSVLGAYGLGVLTIAFGTSLGLLFGRNGGRSYLLPVAMLGLFAVMWGWGALRLAEPVPSVPDVQVRIVQPNIAEAEKFDPRFAVRNWNRLLELSRRPAPVPPTHIVWPESAVPFFLEREPAALDAITVLTGNSHVLITGASRVATQSNGKPNYYNSVYIFGHRGEILGVYDKFHLVPFGEYLPLESFFHALGVDRLVNSPGGFSAGPGPRTFTLPGAPAVGPLVCYEIIFPGDVAGQPRPGWLVNVTNDAWFGTFSGPYQHLLIARVRAIEEGLPIVRAAGTGVSAIIDPKGRVVAELGMERMGVLDGALPAALPATFYAKHGDLLYVVLVILMGGLAGVLLRPTN
ncbi:MAG TPA: apolipoprotein N-acyltransferase [Rhizomicrobium sp.]|nr:apolipoprotein N-acyltransferase [Rhizomicrobium sp.]